MNTTEALSVLIAEDDALISDGIATQLDRLGFNTVGQAYDGEQAVTMVCQNQPSVVLMDLQMIDPETGREDVQAGLKATRAIQERRPTAVIVLSAHESPELVREASEAGVSGYLVKPAGDQEIARSILIARARFGESLNLRGRVTDLEERNTVIRTALANTKTLRGLLSVCAWCKRVRGDQGFWQEFEAYVQDHSEATFSHGVCPDCQKRIFPRSRPTS